MEKHPCFVRIFILFYKFRKNICNVTANAVDDVQFCEQVIGNKPERVVNLLVMYTKNAQ